MERRGTLEAQAAYVLGPKESHLDCGQVGKKRASAATILPPLLPGGRDITASHPAMLLRKGNLVPHASAKEITPFYANGLCYIYGGRNCLRRSLLTTEKSSMP
jgi:hypothetical protein